MNLTVTVDGRTYVVTVEDPNARPVVAVVAGERFEIWPEETQSAPAAYASGTAAMPATPASALPPAPAESAANSERTITAPIPGVIVGIAVAAGDTVAEGQEICSLEAMKMKNSIRATRAGKIAALRVAVGDQVRHGQVIAEYAD